MSQSEIVVFRTFLNHFDADLARMALEAAGIERLFAAMTAAACARICGWGVRCRCTSTTWSAPRKSWE